MTQKTFQDLINEVHDKGICQECGGCVSFCSSAEYNIIGFPDPNLPPEYINKDQCLECGICYYICPQTKILKNELNSTYNTLNYEESPIGFYEDIFSSQTLDEDFLKVGTDGGVVNSLISFFIEEKIIDGAIVSKLENPFSKEATIAYNKEDLISASGATLDISQQLNEIQKFCTYTHSIPKLNHYKFKKLAVVGTPCQLYTIRCMQNLGVIPSQNIELCLGLFCFENFLFLRNQIDKFEKDFNVDFSNIHKINIKEDLILKIKDKDETHRVVHIPFNHLDEYMRSACNTCDDFTNIYADISFGGLGSPEKYTTVIPRTKKGRELFSLAINAGIIKNLKQTPDKQSKLIDIISQYAQSKLKRMQNFIQNIQIR